MDEDRLQGSRANWRPSAQCPGSDDEAELLRLQSEFASGQQRPAAKATRIVRKAEACAPPASKPAISQEQPTTNSCSSPCDDFNGLLPGLLGILTNVQEKLALGHVAPPSGPAGGAAFPKATHRKLSKFALSRQQPKAPQTPGHAPNVTLPESASCIPPSADRVQSSPTTPGLPPSMQSPNAASGLKAVADAARGPGDDQQVVQRDILRQSEGSSPQGYTLQEACMLARSSLTQQRVLALHILAAVLAAARPQATHQQAAGVLTPRPVKIPLHLSTSDNMVTRVTWLLVWEYALQEVLERISFLLRSPAALSATTPLLVILQSYTMAGVDAARAVWRCPGMQKALQGLLQGPAGSLPSDRAAELSASALITVRMLASSDAQLFTVVVSSGLLLHAQRVLAVATTSSSSIGDQLQRLNLQVEALHVWRLCADHNVPFMHLDDAYAAICRLFSPTSSAPPTPSHMDNDDHIISDHVDGHVGVPHGSRAMASKAALLHKLQLQASCQAFLLLGSLVRHANREPDKAMLSIINALSGQVLISRTAQAGLVEIQPWTATWFQQQMPHSKLLLHALQHVDVSSLKAGPSADAYSPDGARGALHQTGPLLLQPSGSRLPLPDGYRLMEITHPTQAPPTTTPAPAGVKATQPLEPIPEEDEAQAEQGSSPEAAAEAADRADDSAALSVGCALLLQLGLEETLAADDFDDASTGVKLGRMMELVFSNEAAANAGSEEELWYHHVVRWTVAALMQRWSQKQPDLSSISPDDAQKWTEHFAAVSYGDPLFALALSSLLSHCSACEVQVIVLQTLADEKCIIVAPRLVLGAIDLVSPFLGVDRSAWSRAFNAHARAQKGFGNSCPTHIATSASAHAVGDSTRTGSLDLFDRQLKRAHRNRAALLQTADDPLLVAVTEALLDRLEDCKRTFPTVAVLGGAGNVVTSRLTNGRAGITKVLQMDISPGMLQKDQALAQASARRSAQNKPEVHFIEGDEESLPFKAGSIDLIVSCLSCHWVNDLPGMLQQCRRALKPDGLFLAAMFGGDTLHELRVSCNLAEEELQGGVSQRVSPLAQVRDCGSLLTVGGFNIPAVDVDDITIHYKDFQGVVNHLRALGESNAVRTKQPLMRKATAQRAAAIYKERFEDQDSSTLPATFQVLYMTGWAPHASQQQPARRGSATVSFEDLQDALKEQSDKAGNPK
ncbi:hypothetical protein WJX79_003110 [Trebouxia sp. C0005]